MGWENLGKILHGSGEPQGGPGWVGGPSGRLRKCQWTREEVRDGSGTVGVVQDSLGDPRGGLG